MHKSHSATAKQPKLHEKPQEAPECPAPEPQQPFDEGLVSRWMTKGGFKASHSGLEVDNLGFFFSLNDGSSFRCLHPSSDQGGPFSLAPGDPGDASGASPSLYYTGCAALCFLWLCFSPLLKAIVFFPEQKPTCLCHSHFLQVLISRKKFKSASREQIFVHILAVFGLSEPFGPESLYNDTHKALFLVGPLPGFPPPVYHTRCPQCDLWYSDMAHHRCSCVPVPPTLPPGASGFVVQVWAECKHSRCKVGTSEDWAKALMDLPKHKKLSKQAEVPQQTASIQTYQSLAHLRSFGFFEEVNGWGPTHLCSILKLACLPSQVEETAWKKGSAPWKVKNFLKQVHGAVGEYFLLAEEIMKGSHTSMRKVLVASAGVE